MVAALVFGGSGVAEAKPEPGKPYPSQAEVDRARKFKESRAELVAQMQNARAAAYQRVGFAREAASVAIERFNGARYEAEMARKAANRAVRQAAAARKRVEHQRTGIALLAAQTYSEGSVLNGVTTFMTGDGAAEVMERENVASSAGQSMKLRYDDFSDASLAAQKAEAAAAAAKVKAARLAKEAEAARVVARHAMLGADRAQGNAGQVEANLRADLAKAEKAYRELEKARKQALKALEDADPTNDPGPERPLPPAPKAPEPAKVVRGVAESTARVIPRVYPGVRGKAPKRDKAAMQAVIDFGMEQLGEPYVWAATGPDRWDCSGFTMAAFKRAGVNLVHYSEAQYLASVPISPADVAPGDLVFWQGRQERINHVAIYIGNGEIMHASGDVQRVNISKLEDFLPPDYFARVRLPGQ